MDVFHLLDYHNNGMGKRCCLPKDPQGINITLALYTIHVFINQTHLLQTLPCTLFGQWSLGYGFIGQPNPPKMATMATMAMMATLVCSSPPLLISGTMCYCMIALFD